MAWPSMWWAASQLEPSYCAQNWGCYDLPSYQGGLFLTNINNLYQAAEWLTL